MKNKEKKDSSSSAYVPSHAERGMTDLHLICILRLCVSTAERRHDVRGLLTRGKNKAKLV